MRTNLLRAALLALLLILAGCNGGSGAPTTAPQQTLVDDPSTTDGTDPATTPTPTPGERGPTRGLEPRTEQGRQFVELAEANGVPIRTAVTINGTFSVVYEVEPGADGSVSRRGFRVAQAYATVVNDTWASNTSSWNATRMEATAITEDDVLVSSYRMPAYWGRQVRSMEVYTDSWLGRRLDAANSRIYQNGTVANISRNLSNFGATLQANTNATVRGVTRRGGTVFVTYETETDNRTLRRNRVGTIVRVYGAFAYRGWDAERMEVEVVQPDGDTYGWYHIKRIRALNSYRNQATAPIQLALATRFLEEDGLDGPKGG